MNCDLLIIGGDGDLAMRELSPALCSLRHSDSLPGDIQILAIATHELSQEAFPDQVCSSQVCSRLQQGKSANKFSHEGWNSFSQKLRYCEQDATSSDGMARLRQDVIRDNPTLFVRADEVEEAGKWVDCIQSVWAQSGKLAESCTAGSGALRGRSY